MTLCACCGGKGKNDKKKMDKKPTKQGTKANSDPPKRADGMQGQPIQKGNFRQLNAEPKRSSYPKLRGESPIPRPEPIYVSYKEPPKFKDLRTQELVMTACKKGDESTIRIERLLQRDVNYNAAYHVCEGPFKGIVINKATKDLAATPSPHAKMKFIVHMKDLNNMNNATKEKEVRELRFWFKPQADEGAQARNAKEYFKTLLQPEAFPRDYVNFIKKAIVLAQHFPLVQCLDLVLRPANKAERESGYIDTAEEEVCIVSAQPLQGMAPTHHFQTTAAALPPQKFRESKIIEELEEASEDEDEDEDREDIIENYITVVTPALYDYQYLPEVPVNDKQHLVFRVKAKADAHIALSSVYGDTQRKTYEIVIGGWGNTKSCVRDGGQGNIVEEATTLNILDGYDSRNFWVSWDKGMIRVGENRHKGHDTFLKWKIPESKKHSINCLAVSTGPGSDGEWEFVEILRPPKPEDETKQARRNRFRLSLLWLAKKQRMLQFLEDAYPNSLNTQDLMKLCNVTISDMMKSVVFLKDLQNRGLITEVTKGVWMRSPGAAQDKTHTVKMVDQVPRLSGRESPSIAIITALYCEKLAVDAMMDSKVSYVQWKMDGESQVYTLGRIGNHQVVSTKMSKIGSTQGARISIGSTVPSLLGIFRNVEHVFLVGVGGAVPNYFDYHKHIRLGDIVVSMPQHNNGPIYLHCEKIEQMGSGDNISYKYGNKSWSAKENVLAKSVQQLKELHDKDSYMRKPWEKFIEEGKELLHAEESSFHRPLAKSDKLFGFYEGEWVQVQPPKHPSENRYSGNLDNQPRVRYGPIGSSKFVVRNNKIRIDFSETFGIAAFDAEFSAVLDSVDQNRKTSFMIIRGMADYIDGSQNKDWQPYASLVAAAYLKALVSALPSNRGFSRY